MITAMDKENPYDLRAELRREKQKKAEDDRKRAEFELALGALMASADGQKVLREILRRTHIFAISLMAGNSDITAFREGERNVGLSLLGDMNAVSPEKLGAIMREEIKEHKK